MDNEEVTKEDLQNQLSRQNQMIQALQSEIGILTGDKVAVSIAYQEAQQEIERLKKTRSNSPKSK